MSTTVTLYAEQSAWITSANTTQNRHDINTLSISQLASGYDHGLLLVFPGIDQTYQYRPYGVPEIHVYGKATGSFYKDWCMEDAYQCEEFDPATVTWLTRPKQNDVYNYHVISITGAGWDTLELKDSHQKIYGLSVEPTYFWLTYYGAFDSLTIYGNKATNKPYITVTFEDDDAYLEPTLSNPANGDIVVAGMANTFKWENAPTAATVVTIPQTSAVLRWRHNSTQAWNEIQISGNVTEYTFPADTFPPGKIFWQVEITDDTGHTVTSDTGHFFATFKVRYVSAALISRGSGGNRQYDPQEDNPVRSGYTWRLVAKFADLPTEYLYKKLLAVRYRSTFGRSKKAYYYVHPLMADVDTVVITDADLPARGTCMEYGAFNVDEEGTYQSEELSIPDYYSYGQTVSNETLKRSLTSKGMLQTHCVVVSSVNDMEFYVSGDIWMDIAVDDTVTITSHVTQQNCPTSGWVSPAEAHVFAWSLENYGDYPSPGNFVQASGTFYWKLDTAETWNSIQASGSTQQVTVPADTFPGGTIQWYISVTDTAGTTSTTPTYSFSTVDTVATAIPMEPVSIPTTGNKPIGFRWVVSNDSGSTQTRSDLQYSEDGGTTWLDLATITGSGTTYTAAAYAFAVGSIQWRVRAYNRDGVAGEWSEAVSFLNIMAPQPPTVTVDAVPFAVIRWQGSNQQAYRITIDGAVYGPFYGTEKAYALKNYLADGSHTVSVEIQGDYSLWSDPGSATFTITNSPGAAITLTGQFGVDAELSWSTADETHDFYIYRDGVQIGHTTGTTFTDRLTLGSHTWTVINKLESGNYTRSNSLSGDLATDCAAIAAVDGDGSWIKTALTERTQTTRQYGYSRTHALMHVTGAAYPVLELSPFENLSGTYDTAFLTVESARAFEALRGKLVIMKTPDNEVMVGALTSMTKVSGDFYLVYEFSLQRIHWEDFVDETNN